MVKSSLLLYFTTHSDALHMSGGRTRGHARDCAGVCVQKLRRRLLSSTASNTQGNYRQTNAYELRTRVQMKGNQKNNANTYHEWLIEMKVYASVIHRPVCTK